MKLLYKIGTGVATAALLGSSLATAAFADNTITGNGAESQNNITSTNVCTSTVYQKNKTKSGVWATVTSNTGGNNANSNTGGSVSIDTGDATSAVTVDVTGGDNTATPPSCCACQESSPANNDISGNGALSVNGVVDTTLTTTSTTQKNKTKSKVSAKVKAKTGKNNANSNTGPGATGITTGVGDSSLGVTVTGGLNSTP